MAHLDSQEYTVLYSAAAGRPEGGLKRDRAHSSAAGFAPTVAASFHAFSGFSMRFIRLLVLALGLASLGAVSADELSATIRFSSDEIRIIEAYYHDAPQPAGRARGGRLPRGIAKNLARGKALPPGIARQHLPAELIARLPPPPAGHERIIVASKLLLVEIATQAIRDVLTDVLFR
jgi:hypothetical protein